MELIALVLGGTFEFDGCELIALELGCPLGLNMPLGTGRLGAETLGAVPLGAVPLGPVPLGLLTLGSLEVVPEAARTAAVNPVPTSRDCHASTTAPDPRKANANTAATPITARRRAPEDALARCAPVGGGTGSDID